MDFVGGESFSSMRLLISRAEGERDCAGGCGRADVLTAVALDAGVGIEETGPREVF